MLLGSDSARIEITVAEVERGVAGISTGGDVLIALRARLDEFAGAAEAWVLRESWAEFLRQLVRLERDRAGEAVLQSISPEELRLRLFALDRAGHMAAEGELAAYYTGAQRSQVTSLKFGAIEFDPSALPTLLRELATAAPAV